MAESMDIDPIEQIERASPEERAVWEQLRTVNDPELPVSIVDLGLVYDVTVEAGCATVAMTLTYSGCPAREMIVGDAERAVRSIPVIEEVDVQLVYSPPWSVEQITDCGREALSEYGLAVPDSSPASEKACTN